MSGSSSYNTFESDDESSGWLLTSDASLDDELSDELTLLNGDEDCNEDTLSLDAIIKLSMRLKKQYNLSEATVQLERCDKIWDTMQLVKKMQIDNENDETTVTGDEDDEDEEDEEEQERKHSPSSADLCLPKGTNFSVPYIKYQPVQGNGNNALPNFYLAVKSQKKLYHCVTCGKQYSEKRGLRKHAQKEHDIMIPKGKEKKNRRNTDNKTPSQGSAESKIVNNSSSRDRDNSKSRLPSASKRNTEQQPHRKRERETNDSPFVLPEPKVEQAEASSATEDTHAKTFVCPICKSAYRYQRGMTKHMMCAHNMTLAEARAKYREEINAATTPLLKKEASPKKESSLKKELSPKKQDVKKESPRVKKETYADVDSGGSVCSETIGNHKFRYIFTCKPCGRQFWRKPDLREHASKEHKITISMDRSAPQRPNERKREYQHYTCKFLKPVDNMSKTARGNKETDKDYYAKISVDNDEMQQPKTMRSGRQIIDCPKTIRPRRACALNTSYTECTKEEEEVLQREFAFATIKAESSKPSSSQSTPCFLCKKAFVDIRKHLIDYHRINSPDMILPLTAKAVEYEKDSEPVTSSENVECLPESTDENTQTQIGVEKRDKKFKEAEINENIRITISTTQLTGKGRKIFECVLCSHKYNCMSHIQRHHDRHTINGVLQGHAAPDRYRNRHKAKILEEPAVDPLALTDFSDSSRNGPRDNASDEGDADTYGRKRRISSSDERLSSSSESPSKRRKIDNSNDFVNLGSESTSDSAQYNNERECAMAISETECGFNEEDKLANPRDTRDSSDRDSGIGISITIKKRNNSYEVVEKDSGDDDKSKDFEHSKDDNTCSDSSSSDATPVNFVKDDQEARRREILNSLDYSVEKDVVESMRENYEKDNTFGKTTGVESSASNDAEANFHWKEEEHYGDVACANLPGKVPSLKVMCRTVLTRDDFTNLNSNDPVSHQCPVCYRFYPTERDVTVHMLEHKVSQTDFCTTRVYAIPTSALIRYGRRPV